MTSVRVEPGDLIVLTPGVTPQEVAAVTAVLVAAIAEQKGATTENPGRIPDAWERSRRSLRSPLTPGIGAWRAFNG